MLSLRPIRRFCNAAAAIAVASSNPPGPVSSCVYSSRTLEEPALVKLKSERDPDKLFHLFKANACNRLVVENRFAFEDTVSRLAGAGRFDYIESLLEHQKALPQGRREGFVVRIIMLYGRAGMVNHALDTFYDMHLFGCKRSVKSFNAALRVLAQTGNLGAIEAFLKEVPAKHCIELDIISLNIVIKAICELSCLDKAYSIMVEMEKMGVKPDVVTYTTLLSGSYKRDRWELGNGIWNLMVHKGCLPNLATFNVRIQYLVNRGRAWDANSMAAFMKKVWIRPDEVTYNLVIKGFFLAGYTEMAKRVYSALHGNGHKPNVKIYQTMVHYLFKAGDLDLAYKMCKDCMQKSWFPNVDTIFALVEGLKKGGQLGKAQMILKLARKRVPPLSKKHLDALKSTLSQG